MTKTRTYPNVIWVTTVLLVSTVVVVMTGAIIYAAIADLIDGGDIDLDGGALVALVFFVLAFIYMAYLMLASVSVYTCYVVFDNEGMRIVRPLLFHKVHYTWSAIKGYSQSEYVISKYQAPTSSDDCFYACSSIVVYTLDDKAYEIVRLYNWKYDSAEPELKKNGVHYLGYESFRRNWLFRQYRFLEKGVRSNYGD